MQITVRFSGPLRALVGQRQRQALLTDRATLRDLLHALRGLLPAPFVEQVVTPLETGAGPLALILVNRAHPRGSGDLDRSLSEGDVVVFVPPMAGG
jgi:molybdopterin converting factor small subunit